MRNIDQKTSLQLQIMKSNVSVTNPQCFTVLSQAYFLLFDLHQEKLLELMVKLQNAIADKLNLSEQKERVEDIEIIQKRHNPVDINNISQHYVKM